MAHFVDFHINTWKIGSISTSSGVFTGHNLQYGWRLSSKQNKASEGFSGDYGTTYSPKYVVEDPDMLDTWVQKTPPLSQVMPPSPALARVLRRRTEYYRHQGRDSDRLDW